MLEYGKNYLNATFPDQNIMELLKVPSDVLSYASELSEKGFFSARGFTRLLRVARTIADLNGAPDVSEVDVAEAAQFRLRVK